MTTERRKAVMLRVSTLWALRQQQQGGEGLEATVRRLVGLPAALDGRVSTAEAKPEAAPRGTPGRRVSGKYAVLDHLAINEMVVIPWQLDDRGQIVEGQGAVASAVIRCERRHGWRFVEQPSTGGQGTTWIRVA